MESRLYGTEPLDPFTFAVVPLILTAVALSSGYLPVRRATRVDPVIALVQEIAQKCYDCAQAFEEGRAETRIP